MRIRSITIELEIDSSETYDGTTASVHADRFVFANGVWMFNGSIYSRILPVLHEIWRQARRIVKDSEE